MEKKTSAADIIAKAKAKRAAEDKAQPTAKPSAADIIAKAKAKRDGGAAPAAEKKPSAAEIIAKAKAKRDGGGEEPAKAKPKPAVAQRGGRPKPGAGRKRPAAGGARRGAGGGSARARRRREEEEEYEEKSKAPMVIGVVVLLAILGGGSWWMFGRGGEDEGTVENTEVVAAPSTGEQAPNDAVPAATDSTPTGTSTPSGTGTADPADAEAADPDPPTGDEEAATPPPPPAPKASAEWVTPEAGNRIDTRGITEADLILLHEVTPLERWSGTSDETWKEVEEDLALFLEDSGAQSNRAGTRLEEDYPRDAFPAVINAMLQGDYTTRDGMAQMTMLNDLIQRMVTKDLGWKSIEIFEPTDPEWNEKVTYDKKIVGGWHNLWLESYSQSDSSWNAIVRHKAAEEAPAEEETGGGIVGPEEDPFD